jgi:hypothetical protein
VYSGVQALITCNLKGRYIAIELSGTNYLTLCEVEAFTDSANDGKVDLLIGGTAK